MYQILLTFYSERQGTRVVGWWAWRQSLLFWGSGCKCLGWGSGRENIVFTKHPKFVGFSHTQTKSPNESDGRDRNSFLPFVVSLGRRALSVLVRASLPLPPHTKRYCKYVLSTVEP